MTDPVISVEKLSKRYMLGRRRSKDDGFRHMIENALRTPLKWFQRGGAPSEEDSEFWALRDVSFQVQRGEVVGVIGRNGAGKSTMLKLLSRITEPTTGRIIIEGRVASLLEVGTGFHPELTGRENIFLNGAILGMTRAEIRSKFDEIVAFSEVEKFLDTPVKRYSSGMYVRLAFAVAAHLEPEILIIDEVLAVGDAQFQKKCLSKMEDVSGREGRTVLFVSHNMAAVQSLCRRGVFMERGRVAAEGEIGDVVSAYMRQNTTTTNFSRQNAKGGDQRVIVENLEVVSNDLRTGAGFECVVTLSRLEGGSEQLPTEVAIDFLSLDEARVLQVYSRNVAQTFLLPIGRTLIRMRLQSLPLVPGKYKLSVWAGFGYVTFDLVHACCSIEVETGAFVEGAYVESRGIAVVAAAEWSNVQDRSDSSLELEMLT